MEDGFIDQPFIFQEVQHVLYELGYRASYEDDASYVWVPTPTLREAFEKYYRDRGQPPHYVKPQLFGVIVRLHYPDCPHVRRRVGKRKISNGYSCMTGPGMLRTPENQGGRPHWSKNIGPTDE